MEQSLSIPTVIPVDATVAGNCLSLRPRWLLRLWVSTVSSSGGEEDSQRTTEKDNPPS